MSEKDREQFYAEAVQFFKHLAFTAARDNVIAPTFSKHRIYINKYQNGYFISREPLHYEVAGWVAESREKLHELLDKLVDDIEAGEKPKRPSDGKPDA